MHPQRYIATRRARSRSRFARPYICRFTSFSLACGGSDADGAWIWRDAYEACEVAQVLFLRKYGPSMRRQAATPAAFLAMLGRVAALLPTQNLLFETFEEILRGKIEGAIASGSYDAGVETIRAASMTIINRRSVHVHEATGAETRVFTIERKDRKEPLSLDEALARSSEKHAKLLVNTKSGRAAVQVPTASLMFDDGEVERRVRLLHPTESRRAGVPG